MSDFHRLLPAVYHGAPLPGYGLINDGMPSDAPVSPQKATGPNSGTFYVAFGEDATSANANRPHEALAKNTDLLDDIVHRDLAVATVKTVVLAAPADRFTLPGDIYVGPPGTPNTQVSRNGLVLLNTTVAGNIGDPLVVENPTGVFTAIVASAIDNGSGTNVIGNDFHTNPRVILNTTIVAGTYKVLCYERSNVATQSEGLATRLDAAIVGITELTALLLNNTYHSPAGPDWKDATTNPVTLLKTQVRKILTDLVADAGSNRIGSAAVAGSNVALTAGNTIFQQLTVLTNFINTMLNSRNNSWGGKQTITVDPTLSGQAIVAYAQITNAVEVNTTVGYAIYGYTTDLTGSSGVNGRGAYAGVRGRAYGTGATTIDGPTGVLGHASNPELGKRAYGVEGYAAGGTRKGVGVHGRVDGDLCRVGVWGIGEGYRPVIPTMLGVGVLGWGEGATESEVLLCEGAGVVGIGGDLGTHAGVIGIGSRYSVAGHGIIGVGGKSVTGDAGSGGVFYGATNLTSGRGGDGVTSNGGDAASAGVDGGAGGVFIGGYASVGAGGIGGAGIFGRGGNGDVGDGAGVIGVGGGVLGTGVAGFACGVASFSPSLKCGVFGSGGSQGPGIYGLSSIDHAVSGGTARYGKAGVYGYSTHSGGSNVATCGVMGEAVDGVGGYFRACADRTNLHLEGYSWGGPGPGNPHDGDLGFDSSKGRLIFRVGGAWKILAFTDDITP